MKLHKLALKITDRFDDAPSIPHIKIAAAVTIHLAGITKDVVFLV